MSITQAIFNNNIETIQYLIEADRDELDNIDEYGFTPLIETVIADKLEIAIFLLKAGADVNKPDVTGRTALHWAVDNNKLEFCQLLINQGANLNAYNRGGQPVLAYPILRQQKELQAFLVKQGASLQFAYDFINTKLIGHRYQLTGYADIINTEGKFIETDFEGFILEATIAMISHSLAHFKHNFAARELRDAFDQFAQIIDALNAASELLKYQHYQTDITQHAKHIDQLLQREVLILPISYKGHSITFVKYNDYWVKCDRGANSKKEGSVNVYRINKPRALTTQFYMQLLYQRQTERFVHQQINQVLGLTRLAQLPLSSQTAGNCSWANVEATFLIAYTLLSKPASFSHHDADVENAYKIYEQWQEWDKDRALYDCIVSFEDQHATPARKASKAAILAAVLFQSCEYGDPLDMQRAEKILAVLTQEKYQYLLRNYINVYVKRRLTKRGNNLLHILDDFGVTFGGRAQPIVTDS